MNYIFYDLEFNQNNINTPNNISVSQLPFEIIQIGALKLDEDLEVISTFNEFIKPTVYNDINPYVENITKITKDMLAKCDTFTSTYNRFIEFLGNEDVILCVWGKADLKEFIRNIKFNNLSTEIFPTKYIDVQKHTSKFFKLSKGTQIGLKPAVELLNIDFQENFHNAFYDAFYTSEIYKKIINIDIVPENYIYVNKNDIKNTYKNKIDTISLFKQFNKMYNREMSEEEKSIIKTAYNMGRTKQFLMKN